MVAVSVACAIVLVFSVVGSGWVFSVLVAVVIAGFGFLWFGLPLFERLTSDRPSAPKRRVGW
jgi:hypothetical protein